MCLGYLDTVDTVCNRRFLLNAGLNGSKFGCDDLVARKVTSLFDTLKIPVYNIISDRDRIKLAILLLKSALKHHSTPWWPKGCTMQQVFFFQLGGADALSLDTLHLATQFHQTRSQLGHDSELDVGSTGVNYFPDEEVQFAMENHGIRNLALYNLGVALLQIGLWDSIPWEDHVQVRRKTARLSYLGRQYRDATKKLIDCDFGLAIEDLHD
ncbi:hypothetical protein BJ170DRAFT_405549 [Xylariales sp. AK1849]|nr:hypothetical protein BJ170DRAFT_405549 [Xylariales sp. AK1849]